MTSVPVGELHIPMVINRKWHLARMEDTPFYAYWVAYHLNERMPGDKKVSTLLGYFTEEVRQYFQAATVENTQQKMRRFLATRERPMDALVVYEDPKVGFVVTKEEDVWHATLLAAGSMTATAPIFVLTDVPVPPMKPFKPSATSIERRDELLEIYKSISWASCVIS